MCIKCLSGCNQSWWQEGITESTTWKYSVPVGKQGQHNPKFQMKLAGTGHVFFTVKCVFPPHGSKRGTKEQFYTSLMSAKETYYYTKSYCAKPLLNVFNKFNLKVFSIFMFVNPLQTAAPNTRNDCFYTKKYIAQMLDIYESII